MSGGPEYAKWYSDRPAERWRRQKDTAVLNPDRYCKNIARRAEMQFSGHWTALPIARNLAVRYEALRRAFMMVGRRRKSGMPLADSANEFLKAAKTLFERLDRGTAMIHGEKQPINGDVGLLRWADDLQQSEKDLLELYRKVTSSLPGSQGIRRQFNATCLGFRVAFGDVCFFTATPDRRHSKLVWRLMRCRWNDTGLLDDDAATTWRRRYAGPDTPSLYSLPEEDIAEQDVKSSSSPMIHSSIRNHVCSYNKRLETRDNVVPPCNMDLVKRSEH